jgi:hypothetical protein
MEDSTIANESTTKHGTGLRTPYDETVAGSKKNA